MGQVVELQKKGSGKRGAAANGGKVKGRRDARKTVEANRGLLPVDHFLKIMRTTSYSFDRRFKAAVAAAPYLHPRLNSVHQTTAATGKSQSQWLKEIMEKLVDLQQAAARQFDRPVAKREHLERGQILEL